MFSETVQTHETHKLSQRFENMTAWRASGHQQGAALLRQHIDILSPRYDRQAYAGVRCRRFLLHKVHVVRGFTGRRHTAAWERVNGTHYHTGKTRLPFTYSCCLDSLYITNFARGRSPTHSHCSTVVHLSVVNHMQPTR